MTAHCGRSGIAPRESPSLSGLAWLWMAFILLVFAMDRLGVDLAIADRIYALNNGEWLWRDNVYTAVVIHEWGKTLSILMAVTTLAVLILSCRLGKWHRWRMPMAYLFLAVGLSTLVVSLLKQLSSMDCPWSLLRYGGDFPYQSLWSYRLTAQPIYVPAHSARCFPAGHASAGYSWIALYFFFLHARPDKPLWRRLGLGLGLALGMVFGVGQQLRGAHFLSHDLWTLMICWSTSLLLARFMLCKGTLPDKEVRKQRRARKLTMVLTPEVTSLDCND